MPQLSIFRWTFAVLLACFRYPWLGAMVFGIVSWPAFDPGATVLVAQDNSSPDFKLQGEYVGQGVGLQVMAVGDGEFEFALYAGGLPGAGWDGAPPQRADGARETIESLISSRKLSPTTRRSPTLGAQAPAGAVVLFDGSAESMNNWQSGARRTEDGLLVAGATSRQTFQDYTLHVEFQTPFVPKASGQARGNSGVYHQGRYETQILDSFGLEGKNNEAGGIYEIRDPDLNMCLPPLSWQTYDIDFTAARFDASGAKSADARLTVRLNGVVVQREVPVPRTTRAAPMKEDNTPGPIYLQDHGNPVRFRNIWLVPRDAKREELRPRLPGFERFFAGGEPNGLDAAASEIVGGRMLIAQLGCAACHATDDAELKPKTPPLLAEVGSRVRLDHLVSFIGAPHQTKPGTLMPDVMHGLDAAQRAQAVAELVSLLSTTGKTVDRPGDAAAQTRGDKTFHTIGCVACHAPRVSANDRQPVNEKEYATTSVPLGNLTAKYTLDSLTKFLLNPHAVRTSGAMPKLVSGRVEARDVACYLLGDQIITEGGDQFEVQVFHGAWDKLPDLDTLSPIKRGQTSTLNLSYAGRRDNFAMRFDAWLPIVDAGEYQFHLGSDDGSRLIVDDQEVIKLDGIHPFSFRTSRRRLDAGPHRIRIEYFEKNGQEQLELEIEGPGLERSPIATMVRASKEEAIAKPIIVDKFQPAASLIQTGSQTFEKLGCASCHTLKHGERTLTSTVVGMPLNSLKSESGCLSNSRPPAGAPDYALNPAQRRAIAAALAWGNASDGNVNRAMNESVAADRTRVHVTMAALNCYACHGRDAVGGIEKNRDAYFTTRVPEMGNEARVPPPLTGIGDKLLPDVIEAIIHDGAKDRPYMLTRMPAFYPTAVSTAAKKTELETEPSASASTGAIAGTEHVPWLRERLVRLDQREPHPASIAAAQPSGWSEAERQQYMAEGRKLVGSGGLACIKCHTYGQRSTPGIAAIDMLSMTKRLRPDWFQRYMLAPTDYRPGTRMPLSFPEGKSVLGSVLEGNADAQIRALWMYLQAGPSVKPPAGLDAASIVLVADSKPVIYRNFIEGLGPRGIAVGYPEKLNLAWDAGTMNLVLLWKNDFIDAGKHWVGRGAGKQSPLGDFLISQSNRVPLAKLNQKDAAWPKDQPRELGYRFGGYTIDKQGRPVFRYRLGDLSVEDSFVPLLEAQKAVGFTRRITLVSPVAMESMVMSVANCRITKADEGYVANDTLRLKISGGEAGIVTQGDTQELRVQLPNESRAELSIDMKW